MIPALIAAAATVAAVAITVLGQWLTSRNDRRTALLELDLLSRMQPKTVEARNLREVIRVRTTMWRLRSSYKFRMIRMGMLIFAAGVFFGALNLILRGVLDPKQSQTILRKQLVQLRDASLVGAILFIIMAYFVLIVITLPRRRRKQVLHPLKTYRKFKRKRKEDKDAAAAVP